MKTKGLTFNKTIKKKSIGDYIYRYLLMVVVFFMIGTTLYYFLFEPSLSEINTLETENAILRDKRDVLSTYVTEYTLPDEIKTNLELQDLQTMLVSDRIFLYEYYLKIDAVFPTVLELESFDIERSANTITLNLFYHDQNDVYQFTLDLFEAYSVQGGYMDQWIVTRPTFVTDDGDATVVIQYA